MADVIQPELDGTAAAAKPDYANDPATHQCPNCGNKEGIFAEESAWDGQVGPGSLPWVENFGCPKCGVSFKDAPRNRRTPQDINDTTTV